MNGSSRELPTDDAADWEIQLDRLVDGELSGAERQSLIARFDDAPHVWRDCALVFLEAQALREDLRNVTVRRESGVAMFGPAPATIQTPWYRSAPTLAAMAASFLLAFILGLELRGRLHAPLASGTNNEVAQSLPARANADLALAGTGGDRAENPTFANSNAGQTNAQPDAQTIAQTNIDTIWLPASSRDGLSMLPDELAQQIEALDHHQVNRKQELWPVELRDGRPGLLPIELLDVHYVDRDYQ